MNEDYKKRNKSLIKELGTGYAKMIDELDFEIPKVEDLEYVGKVETEKKSVKKEKPQK